VKSIAISCLALAASLAAGCASTSAPRGTDNPALVTGALKSVNPLDIVVLPIQNSTGLSNLPLEEMRHDFHAGLVRQRYSPLALDYVDARTVEASYSPGDLQEQAIFQVFLSGWDDSQWKTHARLGIEAEVYLLDSRHPDVRQPLWGGKADRKIDLSGERPNFPTDSALVRRAVEKYTQDVLASLPARNPEVVAK
jgi:hypothetical protein